MQGQGIQSLLSTLQRPANRPCNRVSTHSHIRRKRWFSRSRKKGWDSIPKTLGRVPESSKLPGKEGHKKLSYRALEIRTHMQHRKNYRIRSRNIK
ncbi:hypothetical protein M413DRAFT_445275 [Hebeloma cylindrosporum]|uniref:Uncharacterized protein n=1 Tax=Hebeloma cylindrosporum TaxID=76867 RepID=A0A0C3CCA0_HEBCY|nr:hypothetical protein M413DRAFT_445275 [Hebeloma cylindrosporum h7]